MKPEQRFAAVSMAVGGICMIAGATLVAVPFGFLTAGLLFAFVGAAALRGSRT